jgi:hypothetical protein
MDLFCFKAELRLEWHAVYILAPCLLVYTCYSLFIVLVYNSFAVHVFIFDYALQVVLCGK